MSQSSSTEAIPLPAEYYLFGVYFPAIRSQNGENEDVSYPTWHTESNLTDNQEITDVRPLARVPLVNVTDSDNPQLWTTRHDFKLSMLGSGEPDDSGVFEALKPESPVHILGSDIANSEKREHTFRFPPLPLIASLADLSAKEISEKITQLGQKLNNSEAKLTLTEISPAQRCQPPH